MYIDYAHVYNNIANFVEHLKVLDMGFQTVMYLSNRVCYKINMVN